MQLQQLIAANQETLEEAENILLSISDAAYTSVVEPFTASLGKHMRHVTDHYVQLFQGLASKQINYDGRQRDALIERERSSMIMMLRKIRNQLTEISTDLSSSGVSDLDVAILQSIDEDAKTPRVNSKLGRELLFLQSHATHHFVIISSILRIQGISVPAEFGVAPSTLKYEHHRCAH